MTTLTLPEHAPVRSITARHDTVPARPGGGCESTPVRQFTLRAGGLSLVVTLTDTDSDALLDWSSTDVRAALIDALCQDTVTEI